MAVWHPRVSAVSGTTRRILSTLMTSEQDMMSNADPPLYPADGAAGDPPDTNNVMFSGYRVTSENFSKLKVG